MRTVRLATMALLCSLLYVGHGTAEAAVVDGTHQTSAAKKLSSTSDGARKKKHKKKKAKARKKAKRACASPTLAVGRGTGLLSYRWTNPGCATSYRMLLSASAYGNIPSLLRSTGWVRPTSPAVFRAPATPRAGDGMLAVAYANPVYARLQATSTYKSHALRVSPWITSWPVAPAPAAGDPVRMATYNIEMSAPNSHVAQIAQNIATHRVNVVALQEAGDDSAAQIVSRLGGAWRVAPQGAPTTRQVIYRSDLFDLEATGSYEVSNPRDPAHPLSNPWVRLRAQGAESRPFYVTSLHITENDARSAAQGYADNGAVGRQVIAAMDRVDTTGDPVIVAGDVRNVRAGLGDVAKYLPAQPTFVRAGYYDAMAAQSRTNVAYNTVNGHRRQTADRTGVSWRADVILMKGIVGSRSYVNVANWFSGGVTPSDHNLVYSDILVPTR